MLFRKICFHEPILLPAKPLNIDEEEDEEMKREDTLLSWNETTQFLSDQIKDALETIPNKSMGSNSNEFWFYPLKIHLFITVLIYSLRMFYS
jgi:hypothetical protein